MSYYKPIPHEDYEPLHNCGDEASPVESELPAPALLSATPDAEAQASAVCKMLRRDGMGGLQEVFPTKTCVVAPNDRTERPEAKP